MLKVTIKFRSEDFYRGIKVGNIVRFPENDYIKDTNYRVLELGVYTKNGPGGKIPYHRDYEDRIGEPTIIVSNSDNGKDEGWLLIRSLGKVVILNKQ